MPIEKKIAQLLLLKKKTVSIAESCTGGLVSHRLTNVSGSSKFFKGTIIAYANEIKIKSLGVSPKLLKKCGAVSQPVALAMAEGVKKRLNTNIGIGITGIAGPSGGTKDKPVGLVYIAGILGHKNISLKFRFKGSRLSVKKQASQKALNLIQKLLV